MVGVLAGWATRGLGRRILGAQGFDAKVGKAPQCSLKKINTVRPWYKTVLGRTGKNKITDGGN